MKIRRKIHIMEPREKRGRLLVLSFAVRLLAISSFCSVSGKNQYEEVKTITISQIRTLMSPIVSLYIANCLIILQKAEFDSKSLKRISKFWSLLVLVAFIIVFYVDENLWSLAI